MHQRVRIFLKILLWAILSAVLRIVNRVRMLFVLVLDSNSLDPGLLWFLWVRKHRADLVWVGIA